MTEERKQAIAETFGAAAATYGRAGPDFFWPLGARLVDWAGIRGGERVLDVAAGTGALGVAARERGAEVVAVDLAPEMVAVARANGLDARVMDAERLDFEDASFDRVLCGFAVFFMPDRDPDARRVAARAATRRLRGALHLRPARPALELAPAALPVSEPSDDDRLDDSRDGLEALLLRTEFDDVRFVEITHDLRFASADEWWVWVWSHGLRGALQRLSHDERERFKSAAYARIDAMPRIENTISARFTAATAP